jgi:hypothetical protein
LHHSVPWCLMSSYWLSWHNAAVVPIKVPIKKSASG